MTPAVCVALCIFCTLPVSVAGAERSFSGLTILKNDLRSRIGQLRLSSLGVNFDAVIDDFANRKARKANLQ